MEKKSKDQQAQTLSIKHDPSMKYPNFSGIQNAEYLLRMQYLLQASDIVKDPSLQRFYASEMKNIAKRQVLRIDPDIKKRFCKRCNARIDQEIEYYKTSKNNKMSKIQCQYCLFVNKVKNQCDKTTQIKTNDSQNQQKDILSPE